jgi:clan AA aspartic protease
MGTFTTSIEIGDPGARRWETVNVLVDSGATFTMLPRPLLERLGVAAHEKMSFELADGRSVEYDVGETAVRIGRRVRTTVVIFADSGVQPLLGAYTREAFLLAVDTVNRRLVPVQGLLKPFRPRTRRPAVSIALPVAERLGSG